jgi:phage protein D
MEVRRPIFRVLYNGKNITEDISKFLHSLTYSDKVEGESDEIEIELDDVDGLWRGPWYPEKGSKLDVSIGYQDIALNCGVFEIDEIEISGPPDVVRIRALAAGITSSLRTNKSKAYEALTLRQLAEYVAGLHGLTVTGEIPNVVYKRVTQHRESDLSFLRRVASEYGVIFSVRDKKLVFTTIYDVEKRSAATVIDRLDLASFSIKDTSAKTYKDAEVKYHNPVDKKVVSTKYATNQEQNADGYAYSQIASGDTKVIHTKAENKQQAELKAKAALHRNNSKQQEGSLNMEGNPLIVAGNNFELTGFGKVSGLYHITESRHSISRSEGYSTEASIKRVGFVEDNKQSSTKRNKAKQDAKRKPAAVSVRPATVVRKENTDKYSYTEIKS